MAWTYWWMSDTSTTWNWLCWTLDYGGNSPQNAWAGSPATSTAPEPATPKARDRKNLEALRTQEMKRRRSFKAPVVL